MKNPKFRIDHTTTDLTARQHQLRVWDSLQRAIGDGLLTEHDPEAVVVEYSIEPAQEDDASAPNTRLSAIAAPCGVIRPEGVPSNELLREWASHADNETCWGLDALADYITALESKTREVR